MKHRCEVRHLNGRTMLYIDGEPMPLVTYQFMSSDPEITNNIPLVPMMDTDVQLKAMASAGIRVYFLRIEIHSPERLDESFYKLAKSVRQLRRCVPDAYAIQWLLLCPYEEFGEKYPNDVQTFDDGSTGGYSSNLKGRLRDGSAPRHTHASQAWRYENGGVLRRLVRRMQEIGRESLDKPMGSVAQIAALVSQEGIFSAPNTYSTLTSCAIEKPRIFELPYLGMPIDHYELHDVLKNELGHRMYLFQNACRLDETERAAIAGLCRPDRMLVFMYAQGFLSPKEPTASADNISSLTGIRLRQVESISSARIVLTEQAAQLGLTPGDEVGEYEKLITGRMRYDGNPTPVVTDAPDPVFVADDPDAIVLGVYKDNGLPAFVMKEVDGCRVICYGSSALNTRVLRGLCRLQGLTLYIEEDSIIYANESYLGLHAVRDGEVTLYLPEPRALQEVFSGEAYPAASELTLTLRKGETRRFTYVG